VFTPPAQAGEIKGLRRTVRDLESSLSQLKGDNAQLKCDNTAHQRKYAGIRRRETAVEAAEDRLSEIENARNCAVGELKATTWELADLREYKARIQAALDEGGEAVRVVSELQLENSRLKGELRSEKARRRREVAAAKEGASEAKQGIADAYERELDAEVSGASCPPIDPRWVGQDDEARQSACDECNIDFWTCLTRILGDTSPVVANRCIICVVEWIISASGGWLNMVKNWRERLLSPEEMQRMRPDTTNVLIIDAGVHIARSHAIVAAWSDATSKQGNELLNVVASILPKANSPTCNHICVGGVDVLGTGLSKTAAKAKAKAFVKSRRLVQKLVDRCSHERSRRSLRGMTAEDWRELDQMGFDEVEHLCDPRKISAARVRIAGSDHCNTAQKTVRKFAALVKTEEAMIAVFGEREWEAFPSDVKEEWLTMDFIGCQHHLRNIWFNAGYNAVESELQDLVDMQKMLQEIKALGIQCVDGSTSAGQRSMLKYYGNTTDPNHFSVGALYKQFNAEMSGKGGEYEDDPHKDCGRIDLGQRQDAKAQQAFENQPRKHKIGAFADKERYGAEIENNYDKSTLLYIESMALETAGDLYALVYGQVLEIHRAATAKTGMGKVAVPAELQQEEGMPATLKCLDPVDSYEMMEEIQQYGLSLVEKPELILHEDQYIACFKTPLFLHWGRFHQWTKSQGSGRNAAGMKTEDNYWEHCRRVLLEGAKQYRDQKFTDGDGEPFNLMFKLAAVFGAAAGKAVEHKNNDYGWFAVIRAARGGDSVAQGKLDRLRKHGRGSLGYSPNEGVFGVYDHYMRRCMQMRVDALGGQAMARFNDTFGGGSALESLPRAARRFVELCQRRVVKAERKGAGQKIVAKQERATKRSRKVKRRNVEKGIRQAKIKLSRAAIAFTIDVMTRADMVTLLASDAPEGEKKTAMLEVYIAIAEGQGYDQGKVQVTCTTGRPRTPCKINCGSAIPVKAAEAWADGGHMREHVLELLRLWEDGTIPRRTGTVVPQVVVHRGFGDRSLGQITALGKQRAETRVRLYAEWTADAIANPGLYSPFIKIDDAAQDLKADPDALVGKKLEVRWSMQDAEAEPYLHCFEGTVLKVVQYAKGRKKALDLDFGARAPIALVRWDQEFNWLDCYVPLDIKMYAKEDTHFGWNVMTDAYVSAFSTVAAGSGDTDTESDVSDSDSSSGSESDCRAGSDCR